MKGIVSLSFKKESLPTTQERKGTVYSDVKSREKTKDKKDKWK